MNTNRLKSFARSARTKLIEAVCTKLEWILLNKHDDAFLLGKASDVARMEKRYAEIGRDQLVEEVAYTWFNRLVALRFMDANDYSIPKAITPAEGMSLPEILQDAKAGFVDEKFSVNRDRIRDLLDGRITPANGNADQEVYRMLLVSACNYWYGAMPFMFERINDYTELLLPDDLLSPSSIVSDIRDGMSIEDCQQEEIIGWLYQFYIAEKKEEVEPRKTSKSGLKPEEIPAATQLFTPHWIVRYMVENSLGRIWMTLHPESTLKEDMPYYIDDIEGQTSPIPNDIQSAKDIRFIDPCMGSGHVLVYAFELFSKMYEEEGYSTSDIPAMILRSNLYGLDIDVRCSQLANFALIMKAQRYYRRFLSKTVKPQAMALENISREIISGAGDFANSSSIYQLAQADNFGSLISISEEDYNKINTSTGQLWSDQIVKLKEMAGLLSRKYHCVVTNPPYLGKGMNAELKSFVREHYPNSKSDLYAAFIECATYMLTPNGITGLVTMESWMFLSSYEKLRKYIIDNTQILSLSHFDWHIMRIAFGTVAFILQNHKPIDKKGIYSYLSRKEVDFGKEIPYKFPVTDNNRYNITNQKNFDKMPGSPIGYWASDKIVNIFDKSDILGDNGDARQGLATADNNRFLRLWVEVSFSNMGLLMKDANEALLSGCKWFPYNKGGEKRRWYGNQEYLVNWENDGYEIKNFFDNNGKLRSVVRNPQYYFRPSISWGLITSGGSSFRYFPQGFIYDVAGMSYFPSNDINDKIIIGSLNTKLFGDLTKLINPTINLQIGDVAKLPCCKIRNSEIENTVSDCINISKQDWDAHETSWDFKENELIRFRKVCGEGGVLFEFLYLEFTIVWEEMFRQLHANEEELNRQFIEIYGLQDELTPDVPLKEITILQQGEVKIEDGELVFQPDVIIKQFISYAVGCMFGRYSLDKEGLILANQGETLEDYLKKVPLPSFTPDDDAIIPVLEDEYFTDDMVGRFYTFLRIAFGEDNLDANLRFITTHIGDLRKYLFKDFYNDHLKMYKKRPIYWMFASAKKSFQALVYMHRMRPDTPNKVFNDYLQPYIHRLQEERENLKERMLSDDITPRDKMLATKRTEQINIVLKDCEAYAKTLLAFASTRPTMDLDDGVRMNYTKFKDVLIPIKGLEK